MILLLTTLFLFARRAVSVIDFVSRIFIFTISVFLAQSIFVTVNLVLKVSTFEILAAEISLGLLAALFWVRKMPAKKMISFREMNWELAALAALAFYSVFCLTKVHWSYTGIASSFLQPEFYSQGLSYPYPYFSDEWYAIANSQKSLANGLMPFYYPYSNESFGFINVQWLFHNFNTGIFQFLSSNPLTSYVSIGVAINILIVLVCYLILRSISVTRIAALFSAALILHITHASNFPSVWSYLPIHLGLLSLLAGIHCAINQNKFYLFFWGFTFLVYPPLIIFILPFLWFARRTVPLKIHLFFFFSIILIFTLALLANRLTTNPSLSAWQYLISRLIFLKPTPEIYDSLNPLFIISPVAICLAILGLSDVRKRFPILFQITFACSLFWLIYSNTPWRFIIDYPRVAFLGAICITLMAGFGFDLIMKTRSRFYYAVLIVSFGYLVWYGFQYTQLNKWDSLEVRLSNRNERILKARPPANLILTEDDLRIASKLKNEFLISDPWKSTVLATAAEIRPLFLKSGTISDLSPIKYEDFKKDICGSLKHYWRMRYYIYFHESIPVTCEGLVLQDSSSENFKLYFHAGVPH